MLDLKNLTIEKAHKMLTDGEITVSDLTDAYLKNIEADNERLNVYLEVFDDIKEQAAAAQKKVDAGEATLLTGIPIAVKDNILIKGKKASSASKILENYVAPYSATVIEKLQKERVVFLGRTNMDEFAMGSSTENSAFGPTKNPHDETRVTGGTSGGSAAAVAADMALATLGSDTGGSVRHPAGFCGVVGLKPTYGRTSRYGLMAAASSFEGIGPITKTMSDAEIIFDVIKGRDSLDSTSVDGLENEDSSVKTIGVPRMFTNQEGIEPEVLEQFEKGLEALKGAGYEIKDIEIDSIEYTLATYYILIIAEQSSNMARYDGVKYGNKVEGKDLVDTYFKTRGQRFGSETKRRIMLGTYLLSAGYADQYYRKAWQIRNKIRAGFEKAFEGVDLIAMPVAPTPAFKIGEKTDDPLQMYLADIFTIAANVAGIPAVSIPGGIIERDGKSLPVGFQLFAPHLHEKRLFETGKKFETTI